MTYCCFSGHCFKHSEHGSNAMFTPFLSLEEESALGIQVHEANSQCFIKGTVAKLKYNLLFLYHKHFSTIILNWLSSCVLFSRGWFPVAVIMLPFFLQDGIMELPPAESCALDDGEEEEVQFTKNPPRGILSKLKHNRIAVSRLLRCYIIIP